MINFGIAAGFLFVMLTIGILKRGKGSRIIEYYVNGRSGSVMSISGSLVATAIGGSATIGLAGMAYTKGAPALWWLFSGSISLVVLGIFWAGKVRGYEVYTLPEVLEIQYDSPLLKQISSVVIVIAWTGVIAAQMIAAGKIITIIMPGHYNILVLFCALIFISYTVLGGQKSVISTDVFQAMLIFIGIIIAVIFAYVRCGPLTPDLLPEGHLSFPVNGKSGYDNILLYLLFIGTSYIAGPDMYSRILSAKDKQSAQKSVFTAAVIIAVFALLIVAIGLYSRMISPGIEPETSFQSLILKTAPSYLHGIIFAALLAAFLSSADTCLLTSAVIMTNDILNPVLFSNKLDDGKKLLLTKWMVIICGIVSLIIALYVNGILNSLFLALSVYTSGIVLPVVMGFYRDKLKLNRWGAMAGIAAGGTSCLYMKYMEMDQFMPYIFPAVLVIIIIVSRITAAAGTDFKRL